jgi:AraC-like DNA-binding protein
LSGGGTYFPLLDSGVTPTAGGLRISAIWRFPETLRELGVDVEEVLEEAGVAPEIFEDRDNPVSYSAMARFFEVCDRRLNRDDLGLLIGQRTRLADLGLAGQLALCGETVEEGLSRFVEHYNLHDTAATMCLTVSGGYARFAWAIAERGISSTGHIQLAAMTIASNLMRDLCGATWLPTVVTVASRSPANPQPCHRFFRAPVRFDSDESALIFEQRWLDRPLPPVDPHARDRIETEARERQAIVALNFPDALRIVLRKKLLIGDCSMDSVAHLLGMHRRTLDRRVQRHGVRYSELLESVQADLARQLLTDTTMQVQHVAEALRFSSAANFATAFRRWTGATPGEFRRRMTAAGPDAPSVQGSASSISRPAGSRGRRAARRPA